MVATQTCVGNYRVQPLCLLEQVLILEFHLCSLLTIWHRQWSSDAASEVDWWSEALTHEPDLAEPMLDLGTTHLSCMPVFSSDDITIYLRIALNSCLAEYASIVPEWHHGAIRERRYSEEVFTVVMENKWLSWQVLFHREAFFSARNFNQRSSFTLQ